jgi:hypothetical protein
MKIEEYLALDRDQLHDELARMGISQRAKFDAKLAMLCALSANTIEPKKLPAFMLAGGKIVEPNKQQITCRASVCRAPHKNRR